MTTPWEMRRRELTEEHGDWAGYAAWREWFDARIKRCPFDAELSDVELVSLYGMFTDAIVESHAQKALEV